MHHKITKRLTPSGVERYELRVWWDGRNAKQVKRRFETKREAERELYSLLAGAEAGSAPASLTFGELYELWRAERGHEFKAGWIKNLDGYWRELKDRLSNKDASALGHDTLAQVELSFRRSGNSEKTIRNKMGFIMAVINHGLSTRRLKDAEAKGYKIPEVKLKEIEFWEKDIAQDFLRFISEKYPKHSPKRWVYVAYLVALNTGIRAGEIWALRPRCLKRDQSIIRISEQLNRVTKEFALPKSGKGRSVPLSADVLSELDLLITKNKLGLNGLIFSSESSPIDHDNFVARTFDKDIDEWQGPRITFHSLRHTAATGMLAAGVNVKTVQEILGHKDIQTTMRYVHLLGGAVAEASLKFSLSAPTKAKELKVVQ
jgi:integrase